VCAVDDIAISVPGERDRPPAERNWIITDAGWMALPRDRGTAKQKVDQGYGLVCDVGPPVDDLVVVDANQEHGIIARRDGGPSISGAIRWDRCCVCFPTTRARPPRSTRNTRCSRATSRCSLGAVWRW
jgi:D-serine deaminase-like pyridoxal phosphate-dependent protein